MIKPSFSDNFDIGQQQQQHALMPASNLVDGYQQPSSTVPHHYEDRGNVCGSENPELDPLSGSYQKEHGSYMGGRLTPHSIGSLSAHGNPVYNTSSPHSNASSSHYNMADQMPGFEDDFAQLGQSAALQHLVGTVPSSLPSNHSSSVTVLAGPAGEIYDKYAVFRELQFEEELVNAWKSPTEEEKQDDNKITDQQDQENFDQENQHGLGNSDSDPENIYEENQKPKESEMQGPRTQHYQLGSQTCGNFSPSNQLLHGRSGSTIDSEDEMSYKNSEEGPVGDHLEGDDITRMVLPHHNTIQHGQINTARLQNIEIEHKNTQPDWARFDDSLAGGGHSRSDQNLQFSDFLSQEEQAKILGACLKTHSKQLDQYQDKNHFSFDYHRRESKEIVLSDSGVSMPCYPLPSSVYFDKDCPAQSPDKVAEELLGPSEAPQHPDCFQNAEQDQKKKEDDDDETDIFLENEKMDHQQMEANNSQFESDWEPAFYQRGASGDVADAMNRDAWDLSFQREEEAISQKKVVVADVTNDTHDTTINIEEAFPMDDKYRQLGSTSRASADSMFAANPFNDNFVPSNGNGHGGAGTSSATPPLFLYDGDRLSNASDISYQSSEVNEAGDIFAKQTGFSDLTFRIEAKTNLCKSDSINIFSVSEDPFDDDFFK
jgi:hypothetical protein